MAFTDEQRKLMLDDRLRRRIPEAKGIFDTIDQIIARLGWGCSRLPSRYNAMLDFVRRNAVVAAWVAQEYPSVDVQVQANGSRIPQKPKATAKAPPPPARSSTPVEEVRKMTVGGGVQRAIAILEQRKKRSP